jgi:hypothetical protein
MCIGDYHQAEYLSASGTQYEQWAKSTTRTTILTFLRSRFVDL